MKRILFPTDFSDLTENALQYACLIARTTGAELMLINAFDLEYFHPDLPKESYTMRNNESRKHLEEVKERVLSQDENKDLKISIFAAYGPMVTSISGIAKQDHVDLIIMGTEGAKGLKDVFTGSHAYRVVDAVECPVLVIPAHKDLEPIEHILFATDFTHTPSDDLEVVKSIAKSNKAKIHLVNVGTEKHKPSAEQAAEGLRQDHFYEEVEHEFEFVEDDNVLHGLEHYIDNHPEVDMLVLVSHERRDWLERFVAPSLTKKVVHHPHKPTMILKN